MEVLVFFVSSQLKAQIMDMRDKIGISPEAVARSIAFAMEQPADVDINEIIIRPTAQS